MARQLNKLSARAVTTLSEPGRHSDGGGLYLIVDPGKVDPDTGKETNAKRWLFMFRWQGKQREMGLGGLDALPLAKAREVAAGCRELLARGRDPIETRRQEQAQAQAATFGDVATALHARLQKSWRNEKVARQWLTTLQRYAKPIWKTPVGAVTGEQVLAILEPIWTTKAETAGRVRARIEQTIDAGRAKGLIPSDRPNPARWKEHLSHLLPKQAALSRGHHEALPWRDMPGFMSSLRKREGVGVLALEFAILAACRSGEVRFAVWPEMDLKTATWTIPPHRTKSDRQHRVPLTPRMLEILELARPLQRHDGLVFPGSKIGTALSDMSLSAVLRRMKVGVTVHGMRSTFRDWAGSATSFPREIAEDALGHAVGSVVERSYRREDALERRREMMLAWERHCCGMGAGDNIVPIRKSVSE